MAVNPEVVTIEHTIEAQNYALAAPLCGHRELSAVIAGKRIGAIVLGLAETVILPTARNGNLAPAIIGGRNSSIGSYAFYHLKVPLAIKTLLHLGIGNRQNALKGIRYHF